MEFRLLGPVEIVHDGQRLPLGGSKPRTFLAALLLADGRAVSETRLSSVLWGSRPPRTWRAQIHTYASRLRKLLVPYVDVERTGPGYSLPTPEATTDLAEFRRHVESGHEAVRRACHAEASAQLTAALALWRGPALGGTTEFLAVAEQPRLEEARLEALEERVVADLAQGRHSRLLAELGGLVDEYPLRDRLRAQLMTALYRCGRQADALEVYQRGRHLLSAAGSRPEPVLDQVFHAILHADPALDVRPSGAACTTLPESSIDRPCHLPPDLLDFTGRDEYLDALGTRLRSASPGNVVISGAIGVGKSALAVHLAHRCRDGFPDGQLYVDLAGLPPGRDSTQAALGHLIRALDPQQALPDSVEERGRLYRALVGGRRILVLLDGVTGEAQVRPLLPGSGPARGLATARARLAALGEAHHTDLVGFTAAEARALLGSIVGAERVAAEPEAAERLLDLCEYLPAAVRAAGTRLAARPHWTLGRFAARLADPSRNRLDELCVADLDLRPGLAGTCADLPPQSRGALTRLALLGKRRIPLPLAAQALTLPEKEAEDLLESLADARVLCAAPADRPGGVCYTVPEFLRLYVTERHEKQLGKGDGDRTGSAPASV